MGEIWDVATGERIRGFTPQHPPTALLSVPSTRRSVLTAPWVVIVGGSVSVWDVATGAEIATLPGVGTVRECRRFQS